MYTELIMNFLDEHAGLHFSVKKLQEELHLANRRTVHASMTRIMKYDCYEHLMKTSNGTREIITSYYGVRVN